eukprot:CAMPEP_0113411046 /NCGR_PEP_ID=MMETSP0013_2-20120614/22034_1 /TAXON_ID=2843 ORGANISM="Skeletonema costatum, Strain 1716" /NCGR_SAMPLE_ID=MMETSP0013_2 /ASSEMBLY_ACC=CAM_ASM_000158 /LENGTH=700 /DNA_ID=CAMNT_0000297329 /DNA_START=354 /DNA_END=2456 /DNA_ORIENTATION=+ /assembly_acc=CAM_ASM_000158
MVWNGRNESLGLGLKAATATTAGDVEVSKTNDIASPSPATASIKSSSSTADKTSTSTAAFNPQPSTTSASSGRSVWNGTHHKIMEISEKSPSNKDTSNDDSINKVVESVEKTAISSTDSIVTKEQRVVVSSPTTTVDTTPVVVIKDQGKEDDVTTNSTAGSSTTNTLDEDPAMPDTVTMASSESEEKKSEEEDQPSIPSSTGDSNDEGGATTATSGSARNVTANANTANNNNKQKNANHNKNKKAQGNNQQQQQRRTGNNKNRSNSVGNNKQNNKGNNGAAGRRKANKEKEVVCAFFLKNMCNRGAACTFRHDNAAVGGTVKTTKQHHNKKYHKQSSAGNTAAASTAAPPSKPSTTSSAYPFVSKRVFDPYKAKAITLAKGAQDQEDRSAVCTAFRISEDGLVKEEIADPPFFSIDVECIATGYGSCANGINDGCDNEGKNGADVPEGMYNERSHRYPGRVAMVDTDGNVLADIVIRPPQDGKGIASYLTPLTGLTEEICLGADAKSLEEAVQTIKGLLPKDGVLVGQAIDHDVEWLGLTPGKDFARMVDISEIFRQRMPFNLNEASEFMKKIESGEIASPSSSGDVSSDEYLGFATRYRHFSLRHVCLNLLSEDIQSGVHNPISDASYSLKLFHKYRNAGVTQLRIVRDGLHRAPPTPSFSQEFTPVIDGVCVSAAGYKYKRAARKISRWYAGKKAAQC